ncbi:MAG TPA: hypothetical protein VFV79_01075 [Saprospiraceae bacterium]|nr:hypothetical protein [Saprospiraceae bacterium]
MSSHSYVLGTVQDLEELFPCPEDADPSLGFKTYADVIRHYTSNSLNADHLKAFDAIEVSKLDGHYHVRIDGQIANDKLVEFGTRHTKIFSKDYAAKAILGKKLMVEFGVWNPMQGYRVNDSATDGTSKWALFPPLGLNVMAQKGLLLLHYPPWAVLQKGTFDNAITMNRWEQVLKCTGIPAEDVSLYKTFIDVNPVAAPGSGESEYPNDYMPIMMASAFFDGPPERDFIKSMLDLYLSPPWLPEGSKYTLPLLICGSPLYDPQAPGWFRAAYTSILPQDKNGIPTVDVLQVGTFRVRPDSKETPYMIGNHMIAAGVTGRCTDDPTKIPNILVYEAQDVVAATFLKLYSENPNITPQEAKAQACERWFGNLEGTGAPYPKAEEDRNTLCALAQQDLFFSPTPRPHPTYTFEQAQERCRTATQPDNPCFGNIKPPEGDKAD